MAAGLRVAREVAGRVVRHVRRHDLVFYAAGLTFYAAIAVVPLLLVAWFVTSLVLGEELVRTLTTALAEYAPTSLGLREGVRSLGEVGPKLGIASFAAALVPATSYGDGLVRAMDRVAERDRRAKGLRGRLLALVFVAALPPVVMAELGAVAVLPGALGFTGRFNLASVAVYLYLVQVVLLAGYVLSLVLGGLGGERAPPEWTRDRSWKRSRRRPRDRGPRRARRCPGVAGLRPGTSGRTPPGPRRCPWR